MKLENEQIAFLQSLLSERDFADLKMVVKIGVHCHAAHP